MEPVKPAEETPAARHALLEAGLRTLESVVIGFSGGVDSTFLAAVALDVLGPDRVLAVTGHSASVPRAQRDAAAEVARSLGLPHRVVDTDELDDPRYVANPSNRCFFCKSELWGKLRAVADEIGVAALVDGSNADDRSDWRPGFRAAAEHGVRSPLMDCDLTKADIRALSRARGLPTWDQPAAPCLASRVPYGLAVTPERLATIERAEADLRALGLRVFRVRHHGDCGRVEVAADEMPLAIANASQLYATLRSAGFDRAVLDVRPFRSGSLNEGLPLVQLATREES